MSTIPLVAPPDGSWWVAREIQVTSPTIINSRPVTTNAGRRVRCVGVLDARGLGVGGVREFGGRLRDGAGRVTGGWDGQPPAGLLAACPGWFSHHWPGGRRAPGPAGEVLAGLAGAAPGLSLPAWVATGLW